MFGFGIEQNGFADVELQVMSGGVGYYIGTPTSRESREFFRTSFDAFQALADNSFTQWIQP